MLKLSNAGGELVRKLYPHFLYVTALDFVHCICSVTLDRLDILTILGTAEVDSDV